MSIRRIVVLTLLLSMPSAASASGPYAWLTDSTPGIEDISRIRAYYQRILPDSDVTGDSLFTVEDLFSFGRHYGQAPSLRPGTYAARLPFPSPDTVVITQQGESISWTLTAVGNPPMSFSGKTAFGRVWLEGANNMKIRAALPTSDSSASGYVYAPSMTPLPITLASHPYRGDSYVGQLDTPARFIETGYISLPMIRQISRFRSASGHDYSDNFEYYRSMKHYFYKYDTYAASAVSVYSPIAGVVYGATDENNSGYQVWIRADSPLAFYVGIFHVDQLSVGVDSVVSAGQRIGSMHSASASDIAAGFITAPGAWRLVSFFDLLTDTAFAPFQARGVATRDTAVISRSARDADPLTCNDIGGSFTGTGSLPQAIILTAP